MATDDVAVVAGERAWREALRAELQLFLREGLLAELRSELRSLVQEALQGSAPAGPPSLLRAESTATEGPGRALLRAASVMSELQKGRPRPSPVDISWSRQTSPLEGALSEEEEAEAVLNKPWHRHVRRTPSQRIGGGGGGGAKSLSPNRNASEKRRKPSSSPPLPHAHGAAPPAQLRGAAVAVAAQGGSLQQPLLEDDKLIRTSKRYSNLSTKVLHRPLLSSSRGWKRAAWLADSEAFSYGISVVILLNSVLIGLETDYMARKSTTSVPTVFSSSELIFCVIFTVELLLRIFAHGWDFFVGPEAAWNRFDALVILLQLSEQTISGIVLFETGRPNLRLSEYTDDTGILRILRIFRLMRILRLLRVVHLNGELQAIVAAIGKGMRSFYWTVALLVLLMYVVGVFITQSVTDHKVTQSASDQADAEVLQEYYGSLSSTMLALFQAISDGQEWRDMLRPLEEQISPWFAVPFCMYIAFVAFALMNILTGIFVDRALQSGQEEKRRFLLREVQSVFMEGDREKHSEITWPEFQAQLQNPHMHQLFEALDVDEEDASELFHVLDTHQRGSIEAEEFVNGCLRLDGPAKAVDLAAFTEEYRRLSRGLLAQTRFVNVGLLRILAAVEGGVTALQPAGGSGATFAAHPLPGKDAAAGVAAAAAALEALAAPPFPGEGGK